MRLNRVATAIAAVSAGLTTAAVVHRRAAGRRRPASAPVPASTIGAPAAAQTAPPVPMPAAETAPDRDAVVLAFVRPGADQQVTDQPVTRQPVAEQPTAPARCGDTGGRTKAGAPCAARAGAGGRCRHHPVAA